jgi:hypothetical protein
MLLRPKLAGLCAALAISAALLFSGCSSSHPRDIHYGTDADLFWVPPDAAPTTTVYDAAVDFANALDSADAVDSADATDATDAADAADPASAVDGEVPVDAATNGDR